jgi:Ser/Thr protein kinase RdoA (MazF antagonist)
MSQTQQASQTTPTTPARLTPVAEEAVLAVVLSHWDLGVIEAIRAITPPDAPSPKWVIRSEAGLFMLKRRRETRDALGRVRFTHRVQATLTEAGFPSPALVGTRRRGGPLVLLNDRLHELLRWVKAERYARTSAQTASAGAALADLHHHLTAVESGAEAEIELYHASPTVVSQLAAVERRGGELGAAAAQLAALYARASSAVSDAGFDSWPRQIVHADWHPGNLLFVHDDVGAVLDFDAARLAPRALDLANGALQFALTRESGTPRSWPDHLDEDRFADFCRGYEQRLPEPVSAAEIAALPALMIEALIAESIGPVAASGSFGGIPGEEMLGMVARKAAWLDAHAHTLTRTLG